MNPQEFKTQLDRLTTTYGPKSYPQERADLLWNEFKTLRLSDFSLVVSQLLGECATAPMLPRFRDLIASLRDASLRQEKKQSENMAKNFHDGRFKTDEYTPEEVRLFIGGILSILGVRDDAERLNRVKIHCRFIENVSMAKRTPQ